MKKLIAVTLVMATALSMKAGDLSTQSSKNNDKKLVLGISVGAGVPLGAYGSKKTDTTAAIQQDSTHIQNGYASVGFHFDVTAGYLFTSNIGAMVLIGGNMNSFDTKTYATVNNVSPSVTISSTSYYAGQYLVGPFVSFGQDKFKVTGRALIGLVTVNRPTVKETFGTNSFSSSGGGGSGFGWQIGAGIQYNFTDNLGLTVNLGYTGSSTSYTGYTNSETLGSNTTTFTNTTLKSTMSTGLLTATVGLAINL